MFPLRVWSQVGLTMISGLTLMALVWYAWETRGLRLASEKQTQLEMAPYVVPYFNVPDEPDKRGIISLIIKNAGRTPAHDVKMAFSPPLRNSWNYPFDTMPALTTGISLLPPGFEYRTAFDGAAAYLQKKELPRAYQASVHCRDPITDKGYSQEYTLDLSIYWGRMHIG